jgi:hypothetical protein
MTHTSSAAFIRRLSRELRVKLTEDARERPKPRLYSKFLKSWGPDRFLEICRERGPQAVAALLFNRPRNKLAAWMMFNCDRVLRQLFPSNPQVYSSSVVDVGGLPRGLVASGYPSSVRIGEAIRKVPVRQQKTTPERLELFGYEIRR